MSLHFGSGHIFLQKRQREREETYVTTKLLQAEYRCAFSLSISEFLISRKPHYTLALHYLLKMNLLFFFCLCSILTSCHHLVIMISNSAVFMEATLTIVNRAGNGLVFPSLRNLLTPQEAFVLLYFTLSRNDCFRTNWSLVTHIQMVK